MKTDWQLQYLLPDEALKDRVLLALVRERRRFIRTRFFMYGTISLVSLGGFFEAVMYSIHAFAASSFGQYFSLLFSDGGTVFSAGKAFFLTLVDSLPLFAILVPLAALLVLLVALKRAAANFNKNILPHFSV